MGIPKGILAWRPRKKETVRDESKKELIETISLMNETIDRLIEQTKTDRITIEELKKKLKDYES